ncbi:MAG TPA: hypothetical protein VFK05_16380 [Polyangiaceae bacterium]|nr:hypothetical protein [Polyangiaceae bacterium]
MAHALQQAQEMIKPVSLLVLLSSLSLVGVACSAADPITNKWDCHAVCQRYADCFDSNYDVNACKDRCESSASNSDAKQQKLDDCHDCIGEHDSCVDDIAHCSSSCGTFITP